MPPKTSQSTNSRSLSYYTTSHSRSRQSGRPRTRAQTSYSTLGGLEAQQIICAVTESRGVAPTVGLAFLNLDTCEVILSEICDSQTYVRTVQKLWVYCPSDILMVVSSSSPPSALFSIIEENVDDLGCSITLLERGFWNETEGADYINRLAIPSDAEAIKAAITGKYFAICCLSAALRYVEVALSKTFAPHSIRITYQPSEGSMLIDVSTIHSLELIQNIENVKSKQCLFGLLNQTQTKMGARLLRSNILQPLTDVGTLSLRHQALEEVTSKEGVFFAIRSALRDFIDTDHLLTSLVVISTVVSLPVIEQAANQAIMLRHFLEALGPIHEALSEVEADLLISIREFCSPQIIRPIKALIEAVLIQDAEYSKSPLQLRNLRTYAVKSGVNGLLDVSRQTFKENTEDIYAYVTELNEELKLDFQLKFDATRHYYLRLPALKVPQEGLPDVFINVIEVRDKIECSTLELMKRNQRTQDSHNECLLMSDQVVAQLLEDVRIHAAALFKVGESIAMLDMIASFADSAANHNYVKPELGDTLAIQEGRHPVKDRYQHAKFVPNDAFANRHHRFNIITGCNMSGKSTYIKSIALLTIMAQIGSFVPAEYASFPIRQKLFARVSVDESTQANVSTFAAEMRETAFILHNVDKHSLVIIDELGRGTSSRDGLAIAVAIAEALVDSEALIWFVTHFIELTQILGERVGVVNLHLAVSMPDANTMNMLYKVSEGAVKEKHYGLALAGTLPFPRDVLHNAATISKDLQERSEASKKSSNAVITQRRRKLLLKLKHELTQAYHSEMEGELLRDWLKQLRRDFLEAMSALDEQSRNVEEDSPFQDHSDRVVNVEDEDERQAVPDADADIGANTGAYVGADADEAIHYRSSDLL